MLRTELLPSGRFTYFQPCFSQFTNDNQVHMMTKPCEEIESNGRWSPQEHERFLFGMKLFPNGPWKHVAVLVKTRTVRQVRTHAQKYRAKLARRQNRLNQYGVLPPKDSQDKVSPLELLKKTEIEPIKFSDTTTQYDECIEFLVDAFRDDHSAQR
ncbi:unnamed protein product [Aphanomyces euteiches]